MTQTAMLCKVLLAGEVISIKNAYFDLGISNISREIGRSIERKFGVIVSKTKKTGKHRGGGDVYWYEYRLNRTDYNADGIRLMTEYLLKNDGTIAKTGFKTDKERRLYNKKQTPSVNTNENNLFNLI